MRCSLSALMIVLLSVFLVTPSLAQGNAAPTDTDTAAPWITVLDNGRALRLGRNHFVHFQGVGHLEFGVDRTQIRVKATTPLTVSVGGASAPAGHAVEKNERVVVRGGGPTEWTIRLASENEVRAVTEATRIRDDHPDSSARIDSDEVTSFFVLIDERGGSTFIYPKAP